MEKNQHDKASIWTKPFGFSLINDRSDINEMVKR